jgi:hypothetical protein
MTRKELFTAEAPQRFQFPLCANLKKVRHHDA